MSLATEAMVTEAPPRPSRWRRVVAWAAAALAAVLIVVTVVGFFGSRYWVFDLLANLRPQLALLLVVVAGVLLLTGSRRIALVAGVGAAVNFALVIPFLIPNGGANVADGAETFDITFLNVKHRAADPDAVFAYLAEREDDLVILAATSRAWVEAFQQSDLDLHLLHGPRRGSTSQLLVLARDPETLLRSDRSGEGARSVVVQLYVTPDRKPLRIVATHPVSPMTPGRAAERDTHFEWIADWVRQWDDPVVVIGDLNATPWSSAFRGLVDDAGLVDSQQAHGFQPTWPAALGLLGLPLDHVLHTPDAVVVSRDLGSSFGSDHRAVHASIAHAAESSS